MFALVRDTAKADELAALGVGVREADYDRPETLDAALEGIERLLLVSSPTTGERLTQHGNVIRAADAADVGFVVYTSVLHADETELALAPEHAGTEDLLQASGLPFAVARNGWYVENYTGRLDDYLERGEIVGRRGRRAPLGRHARRLRRGRGLAAHRRHHRPAGLLGARRAGVLDEPTSPRRSPRPPARRSSTATCRPSEYTDLLRSAGMDEGTAGFVTCLELSIARGELETDSPALENLLGRAPTSLVDAIRAARVRPAR